MFGSQLCGLGYARFTWVTTGFYWVFATLHWPQWIHKPPCMSQGSRGNSKVFRWIYIGHNKTKLGTSLHSLQQVLPGRTASPPVTPIYKSHRLQFRLNTFGHWIYAGHTKVCTYYWNYTGHRGPRSVFTRPHRSKGVSSTCTGYTCRCGSHQLYTRRLQ